MNAHVDGRRLNTLTMYSSAAVLREAQVYMPRCKWCGRRPTVEAVSLPAKLAVSFIYRCHHRIRTVTVDVRLAFTGGVAASAYIREPFPLPARPHQLTPPMPRGWVTGPDGGRVWLMPAKESRCSA
jgi:hypothetical protein